MINANIFLDPLHAKKNMSPKLGALKAMGLHLYEKAIQAATKQHVEDTIEQYFLKQSTYLSRFPKEQLYYAYFNLQDGFTTSQAAESQTNASLRNQIRSVEPQKMLVNVVLTQRRNLVQNKNVVRYFEKPVPPRVEEHISDLLARSKIYKSTLRWMNGTN